MHFSLSISSYIKKDKKKVRNYSFDLCTHSHLLTDTNALAKIC